MAEPWMGDACSLVDAFRAKELSPLEALEACLAAIEGSGLNAVSHVDAEAARIAASTADVSLPFGGVPMGIKELERVAGWPYNEASLAFGDRLADGDSVVAERLRAAGAVLAAQTTASEFGGVNVTRTKRHGATRNPWDLEATPGGSSGGSSAAVAGGLVPIASGGDGGGSIRIPASFTGLLGLKGTFGRIPKGPHMQVNPLTAVLGCLARSVRDAARWYDVCAGHDRFDPYSLPKVDGWEAGLGRQEVRGLRVVVSPDLGGKAVVRPEVAELVETAAAALIADAGLERVDVPVSVPGFGAEWALAGVVGILADLDELYPDCESQLTSDIRFILQFATAGYDLRAAARVENQRTALNDAMGTLFGQVDLVITATCPDVAFEATGGMRTTVGDRDLVAELGFDMALGNNGALSIPANVYGSPGVSIPVGQVDGLPVGMQVMARHHEEAALLDLALIAERERPWPLVAPSSPI
jgi:aspartyl-tRNA(Asn)/glutamyl-tRNA(Gln) amidotransferase subunit A